MIVSYWKPLSVQFPYLEEKASSQRLEELRERWNTLSKREKETALRVGRGTLNKIIAAEMQISERTVQVHRANVYQKLGVKNAVDLSKELLKLGEDSA
ncbi:MAG: LuxR C-terminal-related transcriptional regulator [Mesosutterella sp.]|nr:LuxR C-terminal-related transcriptional regulator [Mesosutterella sp.]